MRFNYQRSLKPPVSEDKFPNYRFKQLSLNKCMFSCLAKIHYEFLGYLSAIKCIIVCVDIHRCQFWSTVSNRRWLGEIQQQLPAQTTSEGARVAWSQPATTPTICYNPISIPRDLYYEYLLHNKTEFKLNFQFIFLWGVVIKKSDNFVKLDSWENRLLKHKYFAFYSGYLHSLIVVQKLQLFECSILVVSLTKKGAECWAAECYG